MAFAERLSKNKENLQDMLEILKSWIRDIIVYAYNPQRLINKDLTRKIQYVSQHMTTNSLMAQIEAVQKAQKDIASNANVRIALEVMTTKLAKTQNEKSSWH
jgi:DNA polymerase-3 subunit delta'